MSEHVKGLKSGQTIKYTPSLLVSQHALRMTLGRISSAEPWKGCPAMSTHVQIGETEYFQLYQTPPMRALMVQWNRTPSTRPPKWMPQMPPVE